jgi:hypothetical protein
MADRAAHLTLALDARGMQLKQRRCGEPMQPLLLRERGDWLLVPGRHDVTSREKADLPAGYTRDRLGAVNDSLISVMLFVCA